MSITGRTLDDLLRRLFPRLLSSTDRISSTRGESRELSGVLLELRMPRVRLSRTETRGKRISCLGEFLWYVSGNTSFDRATEKCLRRLAKLKALLRNPAERIVENVCGRIGRIPGAFPARESASYLKNAGYPSTQEQNAQAAAVTANSERFRSPDPPRVQLLP